MNSVGIDSASVARLLANIADRDLWGELLELQLVDRPDVLTMRSRKPDDGQYVAIEDLAHGQRCTAILVTLLADGATPILVDQPEDALHATMDRGIPRRPAALTAVQLLDEFFTLLLQLLQARQRLGVQLLLARLGLGEFGLPEEHRADRLLVVAITLQSQSPTVCRPFRGCHQRTKHEPAHTPATVEGSGRSRAV